MKISDVYQCDVCGKRAEWDSGNGWSSHTFLYDVRMDMEFHICSEYCDRILLDKSLAQKRKLYFNNKKTKI